MHRTQFGLLAVLVLGTVWATGDHAHAQRDADEEALVNAFRPLVAKSPWKVSTSPITLTVMLEQSQRAPKSKRRAYTKGWLRGHALSAVIEINDANVECMVSVFKTEKEAAAWVALEKLIRKREKSTKDTKIKTRRLTDDAGHGGSIPGWFLDRTIDFGGPRLKLRMHVIQRGRLVAMISVMDAPLVSLEAQWRILDYVDAHLRDPVAAQELPEPDFAAAHEPVLFFLQDRNKKPVAGANVRVWCGGTEVGAFRSDAYGVAHLGALDRSQPHTVEIVPGEGHAPFARVRYADWSPSRKILRLEPGWTLTGVLKDAEGEPARGVLHFKKALRGWPPVETDDEGRFAVLGLPKRTVEVVALDVAPDAVLDVATLSGPWTKLKPSKEPAELVLATP